MPTVYVSKDALEALPERDKHDHYPTAQWYADALVQWTVMRYCAGWDTLCPLVLDPGMGNVPVFARAAKRALPHAFTIGVELRTVEPPSDVDKAFVGQDYLTFNDTGGVDIVVGNPPFKHAEAFVRHAMTHLTVCGIVAFLLPLTFLSSSRRAFGLYHEYPLRHIAFLPNRPSFSGNGKTAPKEYCWLVWQKDYKGKPNVDWLPVRKPDHDEQ